MPVTKYIYNPLTEAYLMETDGDGNVTARYTQEPVKYGDIQAQHRIDPATGVGKSYYYHPYALGSTRELTDASGNVVATYNYDAFGNTIASTGTVENPFRFTGNVGYYWDEELQTYHIRARNYQPTTGRWTSQDPIGFAGGINLYRAYFVPYGTDPSGKKKFPYPDPRPYPGDPDNVGDVSIDVKVTNVCKCVHPTFIEIAVTVTTITDGFNLVAHGQFELHIDRCRIQAQNSQSRVRSNTAEPIKYVKVIEEGCAERNRGSISIRLVDLVNQYVSPLGSPTKPTTGVSQIYRVGWDWSCSNNCCSQMCSVSKPVQTWVVLEEQDVVNHNLSDPGPMRPDKWCFDRQFENEDWMRQYQ